jgi:anti-sigma B factor antagonist
MAIEISSIEVQGVLVLDVNGRVDSVTAIALGEQLLEAFELDKHKIVLDLDGVEYVTSAGLREIMSALKRAQASGGALRLANLSARVTEVLELTGLIDLLDVFATRDEAVESFM